MNAPMKEFIYEVGRNGDQVKIVAESKFAAKSKLARREDISPDTERKLIEVREVRG